MRLGTSKIRLSAVAAFALFLPACTTTYDTRDEPVSVTLDRILADPMSYSNTTVQVEGLLAYELEVQESELVAVRGPELVGDVSKGEGSLPLFANHDFPTSLNGKYVIATGKLDTSCFEADAAMDAAIERAGNRYLSFHYAGDSICNFVYGQPFLANAVVQAPEAQQ